MLQQPIYMENDNKNPKNHLDNLNTYGLQDNDRHKQSCVIQILMLTANESMTVKIVESPKSQAMSFKSI